MRVAIFRIFNWNKEAQSKKGYCKPMNYKPPPFKGLTTRNPLLIPTKGKGFRNQGPTLRQRNLVVAFTVMATICEASPATPVSQVLSCRQSSRLSVEDLECGVCDWDQGIPEV